MAQYMPKEDILQRVFDETKDRIRVDAELEVSDIEIGAVEIKDGASDTRVTVITTNNVNSLAVTLYPNPSKAKVTNFGSSSVASGATITLATYTVPASKRFYFMGGMIGGNESGEFTFEINSVVVGLYRNSGSNRSAVVTLLNEPEASSTAVIDIRVKNIGDKTRTFEATLMGYTLPV